MKILAKSLFLSLTVLPIAAGLLYCVLYALGVVGLASSGFTLAHYAKVFVEGYFLQALAYSLYQALVGCTLSLFIAFILFYALQAKGKGKLSSGWLPLYIPLLMPPMVVAFVFFVLWSNSGWVARLLYNFHWIQGPVDMVNVVNGKGGMAIVLAHLFLAVPFFTINLFNSYHSQKLAALRTLSYSLGAGLRDTVIRIELPTLLKSMKRVVLLYFVFMLGAYEIPLLLGSESSRMLSLVVLDKLTRFDVLAKPQAYAMASMYLLLVGTLVFAIFSTFKKEVA